MPKGVQNINPEILERLRAKVVQSLAFSLNSNKSYNLLSNLIFDRTGALLSNSTLRRVFQYNSDNHPTKSTLDLICKCIGFANWEEFNGNESDESHSDLNYVITTFRLQGINDHELIKKVIIKHSDNPQVFDLLETIVQIAISNRDIKFLKELFDLPAVFDNNKDTLAIFYFINKLVITLNKSGLMPELVEYYGSNPKSQEFMVEWYVDEDNLNGYYYQLLQVYSQHKTTPEAQLFYNCLMYQHALENKLPTGPWADFLNQFDETLPVHHIPRARRLAILLLEAKENSGIVSDVLGKTRHLYQGLNEDEKINIALYMVKLLFVAQKDELIHTILLLAPDIIATNKNIHDRININQIIIYRAYSLFKRGEKENALLKLNAFDPLYVDTFIHYHIMHDFRIISDLIQN
jgi:hypothetical protein